MTQAIWKTKQLGTMLLGVSTDGQPRDEDIDASLNLHKTEAVQTAVIWSLGDTKLTPAQRKRSAESMGKHRSYVVTDSTFVRGLVTAFAWLGNPMRACSPDAIAQAVDDLGVPAGYSREQIVTALHQLRDEVISEQRNKAAS